MSGLREGVRVSVYCLVGTAPKQWSATRGGDNARLTFWCSDGMERAQDETWV